MNKPLTLEDVLPLTPGAIVDVKEQLKHPEKWLNIWFCPQCDCPNDVTAGACIACNLEKEEF